MDAVPLRAGLHTWGRTLELAIAHDPVHYRDLAVNSQPKKTALKPARKRGYPPSMDCP